MKSTKTSRFSKPSHILVGSIAACAVLGLASSASADHHDWRGTGFTPLAVDLLWNNGANWSPSVVPAAGDTIRFELFVGDAGTTPGSPIVMNVNYNDVGLDGVGALSSVRFTGNEDVSIENYLKVTSTTTALQLQNGSLGAAGVVVPSTGTINATINLASPSGRPQPTINFTGGNWVAGNVKIESSGQGGIIKVSSSAGTLTPGAVIFDQSLGALADRPTFSFALDAAGVAPIALTAADPLQLTGAAAGTNPFKLNVEAALYAGVGVDIPLITHTNDADRLFSAGNITIANVPAGKGAFVTQHNLGTTLTLTNAVDWSGGATPDTQWATAGNWGGTVPGATLDNTIANFPTAAVNDKFTVTLDGTSPTLAVLNINSGTLAAKTYSIGQGTSGNINLGATPTNSAFAAAQINVLKGTSNTISAPVTLLMNGQVSTAASTSLAMSGAISGAFALAKEGDGTLTLSSATNSYSGATNINGGILEIGTAGLLGSGTYAGNIAMASGTTFRYNSTANQILSGVISGVGTLQKQNTGTLTLSNANTFTSNTAVTAGKIALGHAQALQFSAYDVTGSNGTTIGVDVTGFPTPVLGGLTGSVNLASAMIGYSGLTGITLQPQTGVSVTYSGNITDGTGAISLTKSGAGTQTLSGTNNFTGGVTLNAGTLILGSDTALGAAAGTFTINGGTLNFNANPRTIGNNNPITIAGDFSVLGDQVHRSMGSGAVSLGTAAGTTRTITHTNGGNGNYNLTFGGVISDGTTANSLTFGSSNVGVAFVLAANNAYTGSTTVTNGTLALMGSNASAGFTTVSSGDPGTNDQGGPTLVIGHNSALGTSTLQLNGGAVQTFGMADRTITNNATWGANFTFHGSVGGAVRPSGGGHLTISGTTNTGTTGRTVTVKSIGGATLAGAVTYAGDHTFNFGGGGADPYSTPVPGNLTMSGGVTLTGGNRSFTVNTATSPNATGLPFANTATLIISGGIQEDVAGRALTKAGTGTMVVSGASSYTGTTTITAGALRATSGAGVPTASHISLGGGALELTGDLTARTLTTTAGTNTLAWGTGGFAAFGATRNVNFSSGAALTWGTTNGFVSGTMILGSSTANANLDFQNPIDLNNSTRTVQVNDNLATAGDFATLSGVISSTTPASGLLTKTGTGTLVLSNSNTYEGTTTINAGALRAVSGTGLPTNSLLSFNGGVLEGSGVGSFTRNIANSAGNVFWTGNGGFAANGGKLTVTPNAGAPISFSSTTDGFNAKTLIFGSSTANNEVEVTNAINLADAGRTVQVDDNAYSGGDFAKLSGVISSTTAASGALTKTGTGTLVLSNSNTYAGNTTISAGALRAVNGTGLPSGSFLRLDGGVLEGSGVTSFTRVNSTTVAGTNFNWVNTTNGGGFSANGGKLTVTIDNNAATTQVWGAAAANNGIVGILKFGSATANAETEFQNPINLNNAIRTIQVDDNPFSTDDFVTISGLINSTTASSGGFNKTGDGLLVLTANNSTSYTGRTRVVGGVLRVPTLANLSGGPLALRGLSVGSTPQRGGVLETTGTFTRALGTGANQVDFANDGGDAGFTGGFSAFGGNLTINIGGALAENVWNRQWTFGQRTGARQFYSNDAVMVMNSIYSTGMVDWQNPLALGGALGSAAVGNAGVTHDSNQIREIRVIDNPNLTTDFGRYSGVIRDGNNAVVTNNGIRKSGDGLLELTNTNTYTGQTIIDAGTLRVTGSISGSTVQVNSGGTLDGTGNGTTTGITGPVNVASGGKIAPGTSVGLLTTGSVSLTTGATLSMEVNGTSPSQYDQLAVTGTVALGSGTLSLSGTYLTAPAVTNDLFFLILNDGADAISGTFAGIPNGGTVLAVNGQTFEVSYFADSVGGTFTGGNDLALQAVPEPGVALSLLGGLGVLVALRRRRA